MDKWPSKKFLGGRMASDLKRAGEMRRLLSSP